MFWIPLVLWIFSVSLIIYFSLHYRKSPKGSCDKISVSFIVTSYNNEQQVLKVIDTIQSIPFNFVYEILIVDDGSSDESYARLLERSSEKNLRIIRHAVNKGKAAAVNTAITVSFYDTILIVDADITINRESVQDALNLLYRDENIGAVSAPCIVQGTSFFSLFQRIEFFVLTSLYRAFNRTTPITVWGSFLAVRKNTFTEIGGFNSNMLAEDMDFALKLPSYGWRAQISPTPVKTVIPDTFGEWAIQKLRWIGGGIQAAMVHPWSVLVNPITLLLILSGATLSLQTALLITPPPEVLGLLHGIFTIRHQFIVMLLLPGIFQFTILVLSTLCYVAIYSSKLRISFFLDMLITIPYVLFYLPILSLLFTISPIYLVRKMAKMRATGRAW